MNYHRHDNKGDDDGNDDGNDNDGDDDDVDDDNDVEEDNEPKFDFDVSPTVVGSKLLQWQVFVLETSKERLCFLAQNLITMAMS